MDDSSIIAAGYTRAQNWSLLMGAAGRGFILAGLIFCLASALLVFFGGKSTRLARIGVYSFVFGAASILGAMICLAILFLNDQFQFEYVASHSWKDLPAQYKIAAVWSGQQGSFLLWACTSAVLGVLALKSTGIFKRWYVFVYALFLGALCGILAYETPFGLIPNMVAFGRVYVPPNGLGLVPSLQNYWVIVHPPTIFTGFGSLTVPFAFGMSAMLTKDLDGWVRAVRPWVLVSLSLLGLGLIMGGLWAYETQGWGGFWAWDPVENVSFVPWLFVAALLHGIIVQTTRKRWHSANLWLSALPFLLFVYGTFLTRSGFLDKFSVHSFAEMNRTALWILLGVLGVTSVAFIALWTVRGRPLAKHLDAPVKREGFSREFAYVIGVTLLIALGFTIALGMSTPVILGAVGRNAAVADEALYHRVVVWFFVPIMLIAAIGPFLSWRRMKAKEFWKRFTYIVVLPIWLVCAVFLFNRLTAIPTNDTSIDFPLGLSVPRVPWILVLFYLTSIAAIGNLWRICEMFKRSKVGIGGFLAHFGVATVLAGLILSRGLEQKQNLLVMAGSPGQALGYTVTYRGMTSDPQSDRNNKVEFAVTNSADSTQRTFVARPGYFLTTDENGNPSAFTWPHIQRRFLSDLYVSLQAPVSSLWDEPQPFKVGETKVGTDISITYLGLIRNGPPGQAGSSFGAKLKVIEDGRTYFGEPKFTIGKGPDDPQITPSLHATIAGMDASDKSILLQMPYVHTVYPIELFFKPMTGLIWLGAAILTLGGLLSAYYRRDQTHDAEETDQPMADAVSLGSR